MEDLNARFADFTGTENHYKHPLNLIYTDGIKAIAEKCGAYWLLDVIASYQPQVKNEGFQIWTLTVKGKKAVIDMKTDSGKPVLIRQNIPFTDFPEGVLILWIEDGVLLLPSEH